jgi:hypothetical protein
VLRLRLVLGPSVGEEEVDIPLEQSTTSGIPLETREPRDAAPYSTDLAHRPTTDFFGMIRASIDQLEHRLQQAERYVKVAREEAFLVQPSRQQEEHAKVQVKHKLERVQEILPEAWLEIRKLTAHCPKKAMQESHRIILNFSREHGHN